MTFSDLNPKNLGPIATPLLLVICTALLGLLSAIGYWTVEQAQELAVNQVALTGSIENVSATLTKLDHRFDRFDERMREDYGTLREVEGRIRALEDGQRRPTGK